VHIASHFSSRAGDPDNSALLLGDGKKFTLAEMEKKRGLFGGVELLVLSACKTSVQQANAYGKVIEGLAGLSQRLGANAVIATLWNVSDLAASERDILFYRLYREHQNWPKSEILRQSQLSLLHGTLRLESDEARAVSAEGCSAARGRRFHADPNAPLAHPYYWAPFVLYGSSR
jgi:CHAT domain-containing protein